VIDFEVLVFCIQGFFPSLDEVYVALLRISFYTYSMSLIIYQLLCVLSFTFASTFFTLALFNYSFHKTEANYHTKIPQMGNELFDTEGEAF